ncbi:hypothetical protein COOONC_25508 [Cooperia oncophora]
MLSQPANKKRKTIVVEVEDESDDDIHIIDERRPSSQRTCDEFNPQDNPEQFYTQRQHPKFHTRNLERAVKKERAWSKPLPEVHDLFFVATAPKNFEDLAMNPKQLRKLKAILSQKEGYGQILLVTGPTWEHSANVEVVNYGGDCYFKEESELNSLLAFLRSSTLPAKSRGRNSEKPQRRLYHIDDLPTLAYQDAGEFRRLIYPHLLSTKHIVVFDLTTRDSSWYMSPKRVFPKHFITSLNICELNFYPVASTFMRKGLRRAVDFLGFQSRVSMFYAFIRF